MSFNNVNDKRRENGTCKLHYKDCTGLSKASKAIPISLQIVLEIVKFSYICGGTNLTQGAHDMKTKQNRKDIDMCDKLQRVYVDRNFGRAKAKRHCVVLVERK